MKTLSEVANAQVSTDLPTPEAARSESAVITDVDPGLVMTSCANCGAQMLERKCKLICSCGYFLSCSDYY
ncbi:MAG: hypothetical protein RIT06_992 [Chloroflexota bacterium]|jgi:exosome complex RNA-binding protein Csl4